MTTILLDIVSIAVSNCDTAFVEKVHVINDTLEIINTQKQSFFIDFDTGNTVCENDRWKRPFERRLPSWIHSHDTITPIVLKTDEHMQLLSANQKNNTFVVTLGIRIVSTTEMTQVHTLHLSSHTLSKWTDQFLLSPLHVTTPNSNTLPGVYFYWLISTSPWIPVAQFIAPQTIIDSLVYFTDKKQTFLEDGNFPPTFLVDFVPTMLSKPLFVCGNIGLLPVHEHPMDGSFRLRIQQIVLTPALMKPPCKDGILSRLINVVKSYAHTHIVLFVYYTTCKERDEFMDLLQTVVLKNPQLPRHVKQAFCEVHYFCCKTSKTAKKLLDQYSSCHQEQARQEFPVSIVNASFLEHCRQYILLTQTTRYNIVHFCNHFFVFTPEQLHVQHHCFYKESTAYLGCTTFIRAIEAPRCVCVELVLNKSAMSLLHMTEPVILFSSPNNTAISGIQLTFNQTVPFEVVNVPVVFLLSVQEVTGSSSVGINNADLWKKYLQDAGLFHKSTSLFGNTDPENSISTEVVNLLHKKWSKDKTRLFVAQPMLVITCSRSASCSRTLPPWTKPFLLPTTETTTPVSHVDPEWTDWMAMASYLQQHDQLLWSQHHHVCFLSDRMVPCTPFYSLFEHLMASPTGQMSKYPQVSRHPHVMNENELQKLQHLLNSDIENPSLFQSGRYCCVPNFLTKDISKITQQMVRLEKCVLEVLTKTRLEERRTPSMLKYITRSFIPSLFITISATEEEYFVEDCEQLRWSEIDVLQRSIEGTLLSSVSSFSVATAQKLDKWKARLTTLQDAVHFHLTQEVIDRTGVLLNGKTIDEQVTHTQAFFVGPIVSTIAKIKPNNIQQGYFSIL